MGEAKEPHDAGQVRGHLNQLAKMIKRKELSNADRDFFEKRQAERMIPYFTQLAELTQLEEPLSFGNSFKDNLVTFSRLLDHAENLWSDAAFSFHSGRFPPSLFLSIVVLEETGKIAIAYMQVFARQQDRTPGTSTPPKRPKRKGNPLYSHAKKPLLASCAGAVVNSRLDRILGVERVNRFVSDAENGKLETLRQGCLYYDLRESGPYFPCEVITEAEAGFYLTVSGELLAEIGFLGSSRYGGFLAKVEKIEKRLGFIVE